MPLAQEKHKELDELARQCQEAARVYRDPKFRRSLDDLQDNPEERDKAKGNANAYFRGKGVEIPDGAELHVKDGSLHVGICFFEFCVWYRVY
ncbi:MAG: hypothetical protein AVDCRST_MAG93-6863 [uncultured Chloroflexia bacterium]|uniref:Uncharacterized protein n=1 Tax=uncultured Chloroflexia bacterium TaxID=1672391 RepID=A0A6J4M099_9CHLR|nr:MAG: hypothetical protein AVDCRST_MAG93-6863 [uncultured Chloroflexia bacterium]